MDNPEITPREIRPPSFEVIVAQATERFLQTETYDDPFPPSERLLQYVQKHGPLQMGYTFDNAASDTVKGLLEQGVDIYELAREVMTKTTADPLDVDQKQYDNYGDSKSNWNTILQSLMSKIIKYELATQRPDLVGKNEEREKLSRVARAKRLSHSLVE